MEIRKYTEKDISAMVYIWNNVVEDGEAFPQEDFLNDKTGADFFAAQTYCGVADDNGKLWDSISCIQTISAAAGILQMQVTLLLQIVVASISVKNW